MIVSEPDLNKQIHSGIIGRLTEERHQSPAIHYRLREVPWRNVLGLAASWVKGLLQSDENGGQFFEVTEIFTCGSTLRSVVLLRKRT